MGQTKIVKRYANRKLYDTERSCYVTLDDIALMIAAGDEVRVVDNKTGEDLTSVTLAQIIFETEKKKSFMPLALLRDLIQNKGEALQDFYRQRVEKVAQEAQQLRETAQERVKALTDKADKLRTDMTSRVQDGVRVPGDTAKTLVASTHKALDDLQKGVEQRIKGGVGILGRELQQLRDRLAELEQRLGEHNNNPPNS